MLLQTNVSLKPFNTFGIDVPAEYFLPIDNEGSLQEIISDSTLPAQKHILGGGSNILLTTPMAGLVIQNKLKGITVIEENKDFVWLKVMSGEIWHELVLHAINNGWGGLENLALIPGTVGAAPIQNIGAYGVEVKETIDTVKAWYWKEQTFHTHTNVECQFGYRDSMFKKELRNSFFITSVIFRLTKNHVFNTTYGAIEQELHKMNISELSIKAIADAVIAIRTSKLPDPKEIGNAGSFFKNPTIPFHHFKLLQINYPHIPQYPAGADIVKVPAGWLIEQCGWKGYRKDDYGVHAKQALVLVNYGRARGAEIWQLSEDIVQSVQERFGIALEKEVQVWE